MLPSRQMVTRAALTLAGLALIGAGSVFLLRALWIAIEAQWGPMGAAAAMGGGLLALGALILVILARPRRLPPPPPANPLTTVAAAFAQGYGAGQALKRGR